jgi:uncharacterized protein (DUF2267 family)
VWDVALGYGTLGARHGGERGETFDDDECLWRVTVHLDVNGPQAKEIVRAVSRTFPTKECHDVASPLPQDLERLWGSMPA